MGERAGGWVGSGVRIGLHRPHCKCIAWQQASMPALSIRWPRRGLLRRSNMKCPNPPLPLPRRCRAAGDFYLLPGIASLTSLRSFELSGAASAAGDLWQHPTVEALTFTPFGGHCNLNMPPAALISMPALQRVSLINESFGAPPLPPPELFELSSITSLQLQNGSYGDWTVCDYLWQASKWARAGQGELLAAPRSVADRVCRAGACLRQPQVQLHVAEQPASLFPACSCRAWRA